MTIRFTTVLGLLGDCAVFCGLITLLSAQSNMSFQYFYDDLGQLIKVIDSTGTVVEYVYDSVGNILQIKRSTVAPGTLAIFNFTPQRGGIGETVLIQGQAFDSTPTNDIVQFNGATAPVLAASSTTLTVTVPAAATTGPISVTIAGQTITSTINFTVLPIPVITSLSRKSALLGASFPNAQFPALTATGFNLTGSTFSLAPAAVPPAATFGASAINSNGTSATMNLSVGTTVTGTFALVATNSAGSSSAVPTRANRFTIVDPRSTADSDGDGIPDAIEAVFGTDPLDPTSFPILVSSLGNAASPAFTVLNRTSQSTQTSQAESAAFTVLNTNSTMRTTTFVSESPAFTVRNSNADNGLRIIATESPAFTVLNGSSPPGATGNFQAESPAFALLNSSVSGSKSTFAAESPAFTVENANAGRRGTQSFTVENPLFSLRNEGSSTPNGFRTASRPFSLFPDQVTGPFSQDSLTVRSFQPSSVRVPLAKASSQNETDTRKEKRKTKLTTPGKARSVKRISSKASKIQPHAPALSLAASGTGTSLNNQQGVAHGNQNK
jgi:YD repeat-containing protein